MSKARSVVAITMGDPAGVGPELLCKTLNEQKVYDACKPLVVGSKEPMERALAAVGLSLGLHVIESPEEGLYTRGTIDLIDLPLGYQYQPGVLMADNGQIAIEYMKRAHKIVMDGKADAIANAPSNKEAMHMAGSPFTGATELFASLGGVKTAATVIRQNGCYVFQTTSHLSLRNALDAIDKELVFKMIQEADTMLRGFGIKDPVIAVSGVNPHCGENGLMGTEELDHITPAIEAAKQAGMHVVGPVPADIIFIKAMKGMYDALIGMFHDTVGGVSKYIASTEPTVVITAGLPFIRTTVAHGTAYDIAYQNKADNLQMETAILTAAEIASATF